MGALGPLPGPPPRCLPVVGTGRCGGKFPNSGRAVRARARLRRRRRRGDALLPCHWARWAPRNRRLSHRHARKAPKSVRLCDERPSAVDRDGSSSADTCRPAVKNVSYLRSDHRQRFKIIKRSDDRPVRYSGRPASSQAARSILRSRVALCAALPSGAARAGIARSPTGSPLIHRNQLRSRSSPRPAPRLGRGLRARRPDPTRRGPAGEAASAASAPLPWSSLA
jgi:hypothetical protein